MADFRPNDQIICHHLHNRSRRKHRLDTNSQVLPTHGDYETTDPLRGILEQTDPSLLIDRKAPLRSPLRLTLFLG